MLQILPNSLTRNEVVRCEQFFKEKLGSRATGVNANSFLLWKVTIQAVRSFHNRNQLAGG